MTPTISFSASFARCAPIWRPRLSDDEDRLAKWKSVEGVDLRFEINALRADVASDLITTRKELSEQIVGLRGAVVEYHRLSDRPRHHHLSELEARVRRIEQRHNLQPEPL